MAGRRRAVFIGLAAAVCVAAIISILYVFEFFPGQSRYGTRVSVQLEPGGERAIVTMVLDGRRLRAVVDTRTGAVLEETFSRIDPLNPSSISDGSVSFRQVVNKDEGMHLEWKKGEGNWMELTSDLNQLESLPIVSPDGEWAVFVRGWPLKFRMMGPKWTDYDMYQVEVGSGAVTLFAGGPYDSLDDPVFLGDHFAVTSAYIYGERDMYRWMMTLEVGPDKSLDDAKQFVDSWQPTPGNGDGSVYAALNPDRSFDYTLRELTISEDGSIAIGKTLAMGTYITDFDSLYDSPIVVIIEDPSRSDTWELNLYDMETDQKTNLVSSETFLDWYRQLDEGA